MEALSESAILGGLKTRLMGQPALYYPSVSSTMDVARKAAQEGASEGTLVIADEQAAGRGRQGRAWLSPPGSLSLSLVLRPQIAHLPYLIMVASVAAVRAISRTTGLSARIKWPNDVLIGGKKVSGILIESHLRGGGVDFAILGIGINVNLDPSLFPPLAYPATSLSTELGHPVSRLEILWRLLEEIERLYLGLREGQSPYQEWRQRLETLGRRVRVEVGETIEEGLAEEVGQDGSLLLRRTDDTLARLVAGQTMPNLSEEAA